MCEMRRPAHFIVNSCFVPLSAAPVACAMPGKLAINMAAITAAALCMCMRGHAVAAVCRDIEAESIG